MVVELEWFFWIICVDFSEKHFLLGLILYLSDRY